MNTAKAVIATLAGALWIGCAFLSAPPLSVVNGWLALGVFTGCLAGGLQAVRMAITVGDDRS